MRWTSRLLGIWPSVADDSNKVDAKLTRSSYKDRFSSFIRVFGVKAYATLTGFLALLILISFRGRWRSLHKSSFMSATLALFGVQLYLLLESYLLHIRKVNRIRSASRRACRGLEGDPQSSSTSGTWRSLYQRYFLSSRMVFQKALKLLNAIVESPLEKGKQRIRWQCVSFLQTCPESPSLLNFSSNAVNSYMMIMWNSDAGRQDYSKGT